MAERPEYFGNFPFKPGEKKPAKLKEDDMIMFIYTSQFPESSDLNWVLASTEYVTVGKYQLAPGSTFDPVDVHDGDEIYYILEGKLSMLQPEIGKVVTLQKGESILMPKGCPHKAYNFTNQKAVILYAIAPRIWDENGPPQGYNEPLRLLKSKNTEGGREI